MIKNMPSNTSDLATNCPLCGKPNQCAMEMERATGVQQPPCWCTQATFSAALLSQISEATRNKACICADCVKTSQRAG
ncbi:cysteine-rich CWC family protein [Rhodoferax lithotrophicus]|nr:cysteine-rich CWC family protein [Rhodoferax sp. MIZ03]